MTKMNLISEPWIPAIRADGQPDILSLHTLFEEAHVIRDLAVKPHERIALMRLVTCIVQAALDGPADEDAWNESLPLIQPQVALYLDRWRGSFELMGNGPRFLQVPNLQPGKESDEGSAATKLDLALATGNTSTLFDNLAADDRTLLAARSAINLLTFQCFSPCGRIGVALWNGRDTPGKGSSQHAPCCPSSMLHSLILGPSMLHTLHANLLTRESVQYGYGPDRWGKPVWEMPVVRADDPVPTQNATMTYLGRLVPFSRAIRLHETGRSIILANGLEYPIFPAFQEATATVVNRDKKLALLPASTNRNLWRQLAAVSVHRRAGPGTVGGPLALSRANNTQDVTLWVGALVTDKAKIEDVVESTYSLPGGMFSDFGRAAYERGIAAAEEHERTLAQAIKTYASALKVESPPYDRARQRFWTRVEQHLSQLFALARNPDLAADIENSEWGHAVRAASFSAYEQTCVRQSSRQLQAYAGGLRRLTAHSKPSPKPEPANSTT